MSAWTKPPTLKQETPEQTKARLLKEKADQAEKQAQAKAQQLISLIYQKIAAQSSGSSANYPGDKQYSVEGRWPTPVVDRAIVIWNNTEGIGYHTMTSVKHTGASRMGDTQTNFMCKIIGPPTKEDHDEMQGKVEKATAPFYDRADQAKVRRDQLDEQAQGARSDREYNWLKNRADRAHDDMNHELNNAESERLFTESHMARHNVHVTHAVPKQEV